jgi:hypothetical protein
MMNRMLSLAALIAGGAMLATAPFAAAEVPTPADFAACNAKAADETRTAGVTREPGSTGSGRPEDARGGVPAASPRTDVEVKKPAPSGTTDPTGKTITGSKNPQHEGMAADRAGNPAYVAAYRTCMRQRGF